MTAQSLDPNEMCQPTQLPDLCRTRQRGFPVFTTPTPRQSHVPQSARAAPRNTVRVSISAPGAESQPARPHPYIRMPPPEVPPPPPNSPPSLPPPPQATPRQSPPIPRPRRPPTPSSNPPNKRPPVTKPRPEKPRPTPPHNSPHKTPHPLQTQKQRLNRFSIDLSIYKRTIEITSLPPSLPHSPPSPLIFPIFTTSPSPCALTPADPPASKTPIPKLPTTVTPNHLPPHAPPARARTNAAQCPLYRENALPPEVP